MTELETAVHVMSTMSPLHGDLRCEWDPASDKDVSAARNLFSRATKPRSKGGLGMLAYKQVKTGRKKENVQIREFDKDARAIVLVPQSVGG